jgi:hypothetical protein
MINAYQAPVLHMDNDSDTEAYGDVEFGVKGEITSSEVSLISTLGMPFTLERSFVNSAYIDLTPDDEDLEVGGTAYQSYTGGDYASLTGLSGSSSASADVHSAMWNLGSKGFIGTGTFVIIADVDQYFNLGALSGAQQQFNPGKASGTITVTYNYIPEPTSMLALGLAAVGGIYYRRRFNKQSKLRGELDEEMYDDEPEA